MANERNRWLMQEALDESLSPDALHQLRLDEDAGAAADYSRLRQVDQMLRTAPFERAPQRLVLSIMARLAENLKPQNLARVSGLALAVGLALATLVAVPLLTAAAWLFLNAVGSAAALNGLMQQIVALFTVFVGLLEVFVQQAQALVTNTPQATVALLALIPLALLGMLRYATGRRSNDSEAGSA